MRYLVSPRSIDALPWPDSLRAELSSFIDAAAVRQATEATALANVQAARDEYARDRREAIRLEAMGQAVEWPTEPTIRVPDSWRWWENQSYEIGGFLWERRHSLYDEAMGQILGVVGEWRQRVRAAVAGSAVDTAELPDFAELHRHLFVAALVSQLRMSADQCPLNVIGGLEVIDLDTDWLDAAIGGRWSPPTKPVGEPLAPTPMRAAEENYRHTAATMSPDTSGSIDGSAGEE